MQMRTFRKLINSNAAKNLWTSLSGKPRLRQIPRR
jgi:hypothetical protein